MKLRFCALIIGLISYSLSAEADDYEVADIYTDLRGQVLGLSEGEFQSRDGILVLLMETGYEEAAVSVVAAADGSASMYFSNGGGLIGAGEYEQVREVVFETLSGLKRHLSQMEPTETFPLPGRGHTRFYVVTDHGVLTAAAMEDTLGEDRHKLSPLFHQVHKLIAYMRMAKESGQ